MATLAASLFFVALLRAFLVQCFAAVPSPTPAPSYYTIVQTSIDTYCKKAAPLACNQYTSDAYQCITQAEHAEQAYSAVLYYKKLGYTTAQAVRSVHGSDGDVIALAGATIDELTRRGADTNQQELFARKIILPVCLNNASQ